MRFIITSPLVPSNPAVLILGGTSEGRLLATALEKRFGARLQCVTSFTAIPEESLVPGVVRVGPFSDVASLAAYLRHERIAAVLVATHPFAVMIARNARIACEDCQIPRLTLTRPSWTRTVADRWIEVNSMAEAAQCLPSLGQRAFLAIGLRQLSIFADSPGTWFLVRLRQPAPLPFPPYDPPHGLVIGAGTEADDLALMHTHAIEILVTKASGGIATMGKIIAARTLSLPVLMVRCPLPEPGEAAMSVGTAVAWVETTVMNRAIR